MLKRTASKKFFVVLLLILQALVPATYASLQVSTDLHVGFDHGLGNLTGHAIDLSARHHHDGDDGYGQYPLNHLHQHAMEIQANEWSERDHSHDHGGSGYFVAVLDNATIFELCRFKPAYIQLFRLEPVGLDTGQFYRPPRFVS